MPIYGQRNLAGTPEIKLALDRLNVLGSVLMIAAHPDDENTALLAYYARGQKVRTAYLSATRGEGGQNLIGSEQGDLLGLIRTQELLAARHIDGAEQFFTRAIDFGFSKTPEETLLKWGHEKILADMVWVIRRFQPDAIVLRFSGTPRDGHGHHQASAILGKEAFTAAADPTRFPEQLTAVKPWQAKRLMWNAFSFTPAQERDAAEMKNRIELDTGIYDPVLGKSYAEIAGLSRSEHRSQGMGAPERKGPSRNTMVLVSGDPAASTLFDGVDITWTRVPGGDRIGAILGPAAHDFQPEHPEKTVPALIEARPLIERLALTNIWGRRKLDELDEAIALCGGIWVDAESDRYAAVPGGPLTVKLTAISRLDTPVADVHVHLDGLVSQDVDIAKSLDNNVPVTQSANVAIPVSEPDSQPFWLKYPHAGDDYDIRDPQLIGRADPVPVLQATFRMMIDGARIAITRPVAFRYVDRVQGELIRPLTIVPAVALNLAEQVVVFPNLAPRRVTVQVQANVAKAAGILGLSVDTGWTVTPESQEFSLQEVGEQKELAFTVTPRSDANSGQLRAIALVNGKHFASGMQVVNHEHIPPQTVFHPSTAALRMAPLKVLAKRVGYIMGAGDEVPDSIRQMGCDVTLLSAEDLARGDLSPYDAIVTGVRAYNVRADLRANQPRLLDYVHNGGTLVVQYVVADDRRFSPRNSAELDSLGPYPFTVTRDRVTVEDAPVTFPNPQSPLLHMPNEITPNDFSGWVQERGLYFASNWDTHYQTVLESHDPGDSALPGGTLYTRFGKGAYIFTAYSWFRQLPAGVPGAYRIFANFLSAGKAESPIPIAPIH